MKDQLVYRLQPGGEGEPVLVGMWRESEAADLETYLAAREADVRDTALYAVVEGAHWMVRLNGLPEPEEQEDLGSEHERAG